MITLIIFIGILLLGIIIPILLGRIFDREAENLILCWLYGTGFLMAVLGVSSVLVFLWDVSVIITGNIF